MHRLFIQDSESPRTFSKLFMLLLGIVLSLVIIDRIFGYLLPRLTIEPPFILRFQNVAGVERLWAFSQAHIDPIVFIGSSQVHVALSPHLFNDRLKAVTGNDVQSLNISLWGGVITAEHDLIENLIIPNHPRVVIYGVEMQALLPRLQSGLTVQDFHNKPLGYAVSSPSTLERNVLLWLLEHSNLVRYRDNMREWLTGARAINKMGYLPETVDDMGYFYQPGILDRDPAIIKAGFVPFTATDSTRQLIADVGAICRQNNVQCILMNMPLNELSYNYITSATETLYFDVLGEAGLPIWNFNTKECREALGDDRFYNLNHLNASGAEQFTSMVADVYANVFYNVPLSGNATCAVLQ